MNLFSILLWIHIISGTIGLISGGVVMISKKGNSKHKFVGKFFFYGMLTTSLVAIPMTFLRPNVFLFLISIFTIFMLLTGRKSITSPRKRISNVFDRILTVLIGTFSFSFFAWGIHLLVNRNYFGFVLILFSSLGFVFLFQDIFLQNTYSPLLIHIQRMTGSFIASCTAFLVVNNSFLPGIIAWTLPTIIMMPLIINWSKKHKKKQRAKT